MHHKPLISSFELEDSVFFRVIFKVFKIIFEMVKNLDIR